MVATGEPQIAWDRREQRLTDPNVGHADMPGGLLRGFEPGRRQQRLDKLGIEPQIGTPKEFASFLASEMQKWPPLRTIRAISGFD
jgi:hypothetical protein